MFIHDLLLAVRHLRRQKINTALHIIGLTLGITVCLLIALLLRYELSFDAYHHDADRTYRVLSTYSDGKRTVHGGSTPLPLAEALRSSVSSLDNVTLAHPFWTAIVEINPDRRFTEKHILAADPEILDIFDIDVIAGDGHNALRQPYHALLTESIAKKFYGTEDPIGKTFRLNNEFNITVGGLIKDPPSNTHLPFSILLSYVPDGRFLGMDPADWNMIRGNSTYIVVPAASDLKNVEAQLEHLADLNINANPSQPKDIQGHFALQRLKDIHLQPKYGGGPWVAAVSPGWLIFFAIIGILILGLACMNFINLSTAQAMTHAREVGIRKSLGAVKGQLVRQFLVESCLLAFIAGIFSVALAQMCVPAMNTLVEKNIEFNPLESPGLVAILFAVILLTGAVAGLYPAWLIAKFRPAVTLKAGSGISPDKIAFGLRRILVVSQFTVSIALLIGVGLISQQLSFMRGKELGFNKDNIITIPIGSVSRTEALAASLQQIPQVEDFSFSTGSPINGTHWGGMASLTDGNDPDRVLYTLILGDERFCGLYHLKLLAGHLPEAVGADQVSDGKKDNEVIMRVLINEKFVKELGFKSNEDAVGKHFWISLGSEDGEIIGVVADFNTSSLHNPVTATAIMQLHKVYEQVGIRIAPNSDIPMTIASIEAAWKKIYPEQVFEFHFLDESIDNFYKADARLYTLFKVFAALAMCISCMGLWGLATFTAQNRTKEIGIRKVLGASVSRIVMLLSKEFLVMVLMAITVAAPLVYYFVKNWLQTFAYRINIGWEMFLFGGVVALTIALLTVSLHTLKAALANPVDSLRSE